MAADKEDKATVHFGNEIDKLVNRLRSEYDVTYATLIGVLHTKATELILEARDIEEGE